MIDKKNILAIIPARSGSVGIKNKNLAKIGKTNLLAQAIKICKQVKKIDKIIVSTDSKKISDEAKKNNIEVPFLRSRKNSTSKAKILDTIKETIIKTEKYYNNKYEIIMIIEPTSPLICVFGFEPTKKKKKKSDLIDSMKKFMKLNLDSLWTISKVNLDYHPFKQLDLKNNYIKFFFPESNKVTRRQQLKRSFIRNGACYIFKRDLIIKRNKIINQKTGYLLLKGEYVSIDDKNDLDNARIFFLK